MAATYPFYAEKRVDKCMPLAYSFSMQTVVETPMFLRAAEDLYSEADREEIVRTIAATPEAPYPQVGHLMPGTGEGIASCALRVPAWENVAAHESFICTAVGICRAISSPHTQAHLRVCQIGEGQFEQGRAECPGPNAEC
jgi:hypothetical protein